MKKIVCARCGAINLEGFLTYPHCAGCSALLTQLNATDVVWWKRPLRVSLWASVMGGALAGLLALAFLETRSRDTQQLLVFAQIPRRVGINEVFVIRYRFDSVRANSPAPEELSALELRLPRNFERRWQIIGVDPPPSVSIARVASNSTLKGRAFRYANWPLDRIWRLRLRARRAGDAKISLWASSDNHLSVQLRSSISVIQAKSLIQANRAR